MAQRFPAHLSALVRILDFSGSAFELADYTSPNRVQRVGVQITATNTVIAEFARDWSTAQGTELIQLLLRDVLPLITPKSAGEWERV